MMSTGAEGVGSSGKTFTKLARMCVRGHVLGRLLLQSVVGELDHVLFDADQTVAEVAVVELSDL